MLNVLFTRTLESFKKTHYDVTVSNLSELSGLFLALFCLVQNVLTLYQKTERLLTSVTTVQQHRMFIKLNQVCVETMLT